MPIIETTQNYEATIIPTDTVISTSIGERGPKGDKGDPGYLAFEIVGDCLVLKENTNNMTFTIVDECLILEVN